MDSKFIIITTCYNINKWLPINIMTLKYQSYTNWECVIIDDHSTDGSYETAVKLTNDDNRFHVIKTVMPKSGQGTGTLQAIDYIQPNTEDILIEVDGDDWLSSTFVLQYLNSIYQNLNIWMTYGQYQMYPSGNVGGHWNVEIDDIINKNNEHRKFSFPYSHLKTYKYWLFNKIDRNDLIDPNTNKTWRAAWDHALCIPMVEMAGKDHIHKCDDILYILNRSDELENEGKTRIREQKETEQRIRNNKPYKKINRSRITFDLKGPGAPGGKHNYGLGNILFQVATGISLAKDNDSLLVLNQLSHDSFGGYHNNILNQINTISDNYEYSGKYIQPDFSYSKIPFKENYIYDGYFQSEKFFSHNKEEILKYIKPDLETTKYINSKYKNTLFNDETVSIHVRRGDYINLNHLHPLQDENYYTKAIEHFSISTKFVIFSDDIDWCKKCGWFDNLTNKYFVAGEKDYIDLILMSKCTHNIIANSTFSWWGAWLNKNKNKKVIAPIKWFSPQRKLSSKDIIPKDWILI
jgi:glycosyltransferase involved in cell wall biosynthesis